MKHSLSTFAYAIVAGGIVMAGSPTSAEAESSVSVTVYNQNFALVKDVRSLDLVKGVQEIRIDDVAASIDATSVHFAALDHPGESAVLEQNFQYDLAGADRLMQRYLNARVTAVLKDGSTREGTLLSFDSGSLVLQAAGGGVTIVNRAEVRDVMLGELPGGLVVKPTLVWSLASDRAGRERGEISYLTNDMSWHAEYVAVADASDTGLSLTGWVSLDNRSGATYRDAKLKLVAGDVNRVRPPQFEMMDQMKMATREVASAAQFEEREFFEYHIYTLERPATLTDRETKQLSLFPTADAKVKKVLTYDGAVRPEDVAVELEFKNSAANGLGMALPAGKIRVYKEDKDGALEFVGEDAIDHTPRDEDVRIYLGNAFDVKGERTRTDYRKISDRTYEETFEIEIRNHKKERADVTVVEHVRGDWTVLSESIAHEKKDSHTLEYKVSANADETVTVTYTVRTTW